MFSFAFPRSIVDDDDDDEEEEEEEEDGGGDVMRLWVLQRGYTQELCRVASLLEFCPRSNNNFKCVFSS